MKWPRVEAVEQLMQSYGVAELLECLSRGLQKPALQDIRGSGQLDEHRHAVRVVHDFGGLLGEVLEALTPVGPAPRGVVGEDEVHARSGCAPEDIQPKAVEDLVVRR